MAIKTSKSNELYFSTYKISGKYAKNRRKKLERELKRNPNNEKQIHQALSNRSAYRRKKPSTKKWSKTAIKECMIKKVFSKINLSPAQTSTHAFRIVWGI